MKFSYTAVDAQGQRSAGHLEAKSANDAAATLSQQGLSPLSIRQTATDAQVEEVAAKGTKKPTAIDLQLFSQQMAGMLKAGVPILRALAAASEGGGANTMAPIAMAIRADLEGGKPLATAMASHPECFDPYYIAMIRIGESTGSIETIFKKLHGHLDFQRRMRDQVKSALRYPMIVVGVVMVAVVIVNFFVIPAFAKVYEGFNAPLPFFTRLLIGASNAMLDYWWAFLVGIVGLVASWRFWLSTESGRLAWDQFKLKIPVAGQIAHWATLARFCQSLSLALSAGLPIASSMALVGETTDNAWLSQKVTQIKGQLERGDTLYRACLASDAFTSATLQMILVGEESGTLDEMLYEIAQLYQEQVEYSLKTIASQIEPFLLLFLGGLVLVLALGIFLPIWSLSSVAFGK
jgi:MSHA biogenesis protein MshG